MTPALIAALIQILGPAAIQLIDDFMKDPNQVYTLEMWTALKAKIPFDQLAGPK
jgi:hypothetical protein